jgi:8-oxo-dGTP diphosphatase
MVMLQPGKDYIGVGVGAMITRQDEVLLLERVKEPEAGYWSIQGGAVEFGEPIEEAVRREVAEELGVNCEIITLLGVTNHILPEQAIHWVSPVFWVKIAAGHPYNREPDKHRDLRWFSLTHLPDRLTLTTQQALRFWQEYGSTPSETRR